MDSAKVKSYVKEVLARIDGNSDEIVAQRNYRKATNAVKGQISALESAKVDAEIAVEEAEELLGNKKYPTKLISDAPLYVEGIIDAQNTLEELKDELEQIEESLTFQNNLMKEFNKSV